MLSVNYFIFQWKGSQIMGNKNNKESQPHMNTILILTFYCESNNISPVHKLIVFKQIVGN